jgi:hypothetical protein
MTGGAPFRCGPATLTARHSLYWGRVPKSPQVAAVGSAADPAVSSIALRPALPAAPPVKPRSDLA